MFVVLFQMYAEKYSVHFSVAKQWSIENVPRAYKHTQHSRLFDATL